MLAVVALLGVVVAVTPVAGRERAGEHAIAATALAVGLLAVPPAIGSALVAAEASPWWAARATVIAVGVLVLALGLLRRSRWSALALAGYLPMLVGALVWPAVAAFTGDESVGIYAAVSLLLVAIDVAVLTSGAESRQRLLAFIPATVAGAALVPSVAVPIFAVTVSPYAWLASIWSGRPSGVGLTPEETTDATALPDRLDCCGGAGDRRAGLGGSGVRPHRAAR